MDKDLPDNFTNLFEEFANDMINGFNNYCNLFIDTMPKKIYRKLRFNNKHYKKYYIVENPLNDLLINPLVFKPFLERIKGDD